MTGLKHMDLMAYKSNFALWQYISSIKTEEKLASVNLKSQNIHKIYSFVNEHNYWYRALPIWPVRIILKARDDT